jgi:hypothetical protein
MLTQKTLGLAVEAMEKQNFVLCTFVLVSSQVNNNQKVVLN